MVISAIWKETLVSEKTTKLSKSAYREPINSDQDVTKTQNNTDNVQEEYTQSLQSSEFIAQNSMPFYKGPTRPLSLGVFSKSPTLRYAAPLIRPQPHPVQVAEPLTLDLIHLSEKPSPPIPTSWREIFDKKSRPPLSMQCYVLTRESEENCRNSMCDKQSW
jgi:hypothetical protein